MVNTLLNKLESFKQDGKNVSILLFGQMLPLNLMAGKIIKVEKDYIEFERPKPLGIGKYGMKPILIIPIDKIIYIETF